MDKVRNEVWQANLSLWKNGLVYGTQGNVSGIIREKGLVYIKPSGVDYDRLGEEMITGVDLDGRVTGESGLKPSVDTPHHLFLYRNSREIGGVCHTHSKFITVFSVLNLAVPVLTTAHADVFGREIPVTEYVDNAGDNIGRRLLEAYEETGCRAIILGRHGLFAVAETPAKSAFYALMAEYCAEVAWHAFTAGKQAGLEIQPMCDREVAKWHSRYHSSGYGQK